MQNIDEFLLRKHCKEGASVATQFLTYIFDKFSEKSKIAKKTKKNPKNVFLMYLHCFSIFNAISKEFKFLKEFWNAFNF